MKKFKRNKKIIFTVFLTGMVVAMSVVCLHYSKSEEEVAQLSKIDNSVSVYGFVVRDEEILGENLKVDKNQIKYLCPDGEKVRKNGAFAEVYSSQNDAAKSYEIKKIDNEIEILQNICSCKYSASKGANFINMQINSEVKNLICARTSNEFVKSQTIEKNLKQLLSEKQIILGEGIDFSSKIEELEKKKNDILSGGLKAIDFLAAPSSGEFLSSVDGYENSVDYKKIMSFDYNNVSIDDITPGDFGANALGKLIKSETWYLICKVPNKFWQCVQPGKEVKLNVSSLNSDNYISAKIESVTKGSGSEEFGMIISCDYMNKDLAYLRKDNFNILFEPHEGIKIKENALHKIEDNPNDDEYGVYVKMGGYLKLKRVIPEFFKDGFVICKYGDDEYSNDSYLQPGDVVLNNGTELYEGKISK